MATRSLLILVTARSVCILLQCFLVCHDKPLNKSLITGRNEVVAKVMFLHVCVILFTGGGVSRQTPLGPGRPPPDQADPPGRENPPGSGRHPPQHTVNERPVRILLECILVYCM